MDKLPVRLFEEPANLGHVLAVLGATDGLAFLELTQDKLVNIDVPVTELRNWKPIADKIFAKYARPDEIQLVSSKISEFKGSEIRVPEFAAFDIAPSLLPATFDLSEDAGTFGTIKKRTFAYDMTNPEIKAIADENDARIGYYVDPPYFEFLKNNLLNGFIKGMALIGKPGTGKSTDAIAVVRRLGGIILIAQLSGGMLENNVFTNTKPNRVLSGYIQKLSLGCTLTPSEQASYDQLCKSASAFLEVDEVIVRAIKLNCPVLLDEFAYANVLLKARFNVLTDGTVVFRHEGVDYTLPSNFFIFLTWNPGDDGTSEIPNALKSRFPIFIVPAISLKTHYERVRLFCEKTLGIKHIDSKLVDLLYSFGNLVEKDQQSMKHHGGFFTIRATMMLLSSVLCFPHTREQFVYELQAKFVNPLWGTNFENTDAILNKLEDANYKTKIDEIFNRYQTMSSLEKVKPTMKIADFAVKPGSSASSPVISSDDSDDLIKQMDEAFAGVK